jgi:hypothetical protein
MVCYGDSLTFLLGNNPRMLSLEFANYAPLKQERLKEMNIQVEKN